MTASSPARPTTPNRRRFLQRGAALTLSPLVGTLAACGGDNGGATSASSFAAKATAQSAGIADRSITINVVNAIPSSTLAFGNAASQSGSVPQATQAQIGTGQSSAVSATNSWGDCTGSFNLAGGDASFAISYVHPFGSQPTTVSVTPSAGYVSGADAATFPGHDSVANLNLYRGVPTATGAWVVPLAQLATPPANNCQDFANSMFGNNVRTAAAIRAAYQGTGPLGYVPPADFTGGQLAGFVAQWVQRWLNGASYTVLPDADAQLVDALKQYVSSASNAGPLTMWVPQVAWQAGSDPAIFALTGYRAFPFADAQANWNADTLSAFLTLLAAGSHLVAISATRDLPAGVTMQAFDSFMGSSGLTTSTDIGNSHYASLVNTTGRYYLSVGSDFAPRNCGLILSFLYGRTVNDMLAGAGTYNTFIQLEGWQAGGSRHNTDYDTYQQTLWNISTYGASAYSEKRATSIFLAPAGWTPQVYQTTRMMPYVGAYAQSNGTPQGWLNTSLVTIPADAPPLPARYVLS
ncbi:hypothetical protein [Burkholderia ubonensis]|uniref:Uncharacterized protein n=1 Tax=Burkholderia ubonensis subsp. mesacidophila TaxID=265293 RepID=A0A2A4FIX6_9BURK|nr:hypothetical protein [Burkholderia ubonensis]PCE33065.1 hypothetical protein BZL54_06890 [Burkholderia ubonensis subsp. mesacidophila]